MSLMALDKISTCVDAMSCEFMLLNCFVLIFIELLLVSIEN